MKTISAWSAVFAKLKELKKWRPVVSLPSYDSIKHSGFSLYLQSYLPSRTQSYLPWLHLRSFRFDKFCRKWQCASECSCIIANARYKGSTFSIKLNFNCSITALYNTFKAIKNRTGANQGEFKYTSVSNLIMRLRCGVQISVAILIFIPIPYSFLVLHFLIVNWREVLISDDCKQHKLFVRNTYYPLCPSLSVNRHVASKLAV